MGLPDAAIKGSLRFSLGWGESEEDIKRLMEVLPEAVARVREMAPRARTAPGQ